ncbi:uncharacterized protein LOC106668504 [Cimex lectularius]|uniref:Centromere protein S n=1 Tax=Cimex lectularius TaxID=79782 RepID=A0A8I6TFQ4_CIMLE|nr:uncharacterized protein LOC106668504 [Cimex lectularius]XP_014252826.1 uncharacterized protein LOC106668504 [Cimex lectularius]
MSEESPSPSFGLNKEFTFMMSQRGRRLVVVDDYKYCRSAMSKNGIRYACTKKLCRAYLFMAPDDKAILELTGTHHHPPHASLPLGNRKRALAAQPTSTDYSYCKEEKPKPSVERKILPKRNIVPPKRITYPAPDDRPKMKRMSVAENNVRLMTLMAINEACTDLSSDNSLFGKFTVSDDAKELMAEFIWKKMENYAEDVEAFANHAGRSVITTDDVKLLFRRNEPLLERFNDLETDTTVIKEEEISGDEIYTEFS